MPESRVVCEAVDLARYPLDAPDSPAGRGLIERCRADLARSGASVLEGFVSGAALARMIDEIEPHLDGAFYKTKTHNPYLAPDDPAYPADHPRNYRQTTDSATLGYHAIPGGCLLDRLYLWAPLRAFVARVLGFPALHPYADPLSPLNVLIYREGRQTAWHFDNARFVVTLLLRPAERGGVYEYAPFVRAPGDEAFAAVGEVLEGRSDAVAELRQPAGALVIFQGSTTLHRVTPVHGAKPRLVAVFSYSPEPGAEIGAHDRMTFYGRVA